MKWEKQFDFARSRDSKLPTPHLISTKIEKQKKINISRKFKEIKEKTKEKEERDKSLQQNNVKTYPCSRKEEKRRETTHC